MKRHWPVGAEVSEAAFEGGRMLYETQRTSNFSADFFEPEYWRKHDSIEGSALGRGTTWFIRAGDSSFVLRHYRRGGLMAKFSKDKYWWHGEAETRAFAEWYLTYHLHRAGLPVPTPIAARYLRKGLFYRADIITQRIENSEPLAARLLKGPLPFTQWIAVGRCIRRFHDAGVCHADLNAHNILLTPTQTYLIDFDRGTLRKRGWWADTTLVRLYRSLEKVTLLAAPDSFTDEDWHSLLAGYRESAGPAAGVHRLTRAAVRFLYICIAYLISPLVVGALALRGFRDPVHWRGFSQRFGLGQALAARSIWVHAGVGR